MSDGAFGIGALTLRMDADSLRVESFATGEVPNCGGPTSATLPCTTPEMTCCTTRHPACPTKACPIDPP